jgi:hypothetical protein
MIYFPLTLTSPPRGGEGWGEAGNSKNADS